MFQDTACLCDHMGTYHVCVTVMVMDLSLPGEPLAGRVPC